MKKIIIPTLIFLLLISFSFGTNVYSNTYPYQSGNRQAYLFNSLDYEGSTYDFSVSTGNDIEPKICDIDGDNVKELITIGTGQLNVYSGTGNNLELEEEITTPSGYTINDFVCLKDSDGEDNLIMLFLESATNYKISTYTYTSGSLLEDTSLYDGNEVLRHTPRTDVQCAEYSESNSHYYKCNYFSEDDSLVIVSNRYILGDKVRTIGLTYEGETIDGYSPITIYSGSSSESIDYPPTSVGRFGDNILFYTYDSSSASPYNIASIDVDDCSTLWVDGRCLLDESNINVYSQNIRDTGIINRLDYSGTDYHCIISNVGGDTNAKRNYCFDDDLNVVVNEILGNIGSDNLRAGGILSSDVNGDGYEEIIYYYDQLGNTDNKMRIYDILNDNYIYSDANYKNPIAIANNDSENKFLLYYDDTTGKNRGLIINQDETTSDIELTSALGGLSGNIKIDDISGDGTQEFISTSSGTSSVIYTQPEDASIITIYGTGLYGYYEEDNCLDDVTIKMRECVDTLECTYSTDNPDTSEEEKLCSDCGGTQNYSCGSYSLTNPQFTCTNLSEGTTEIDLYLYTDKNENTPATMLSTNISVLNGTDGVTCNVDSQLIEKPLVDEDEIDNGDTTPDEEDEEDDGWTGGEVDIENPQDAVNLLPFFWRIVFGIGIVIGIVTSVGGFVSNPTPGLLVFTGIIGFILVTAMGFLPAYFLVVGMMAIVLFLIVSHFVSRGS
ncbi:MAG: hypothetical protein ACQERX_02105 [Bacillota bacterium]